MFVSSELDASQGSSKEKGQESLRMKSSDPAQERAAAASKGSSKGKAASSKEKEAASKGSSRGKKP